MLTCEVPPTSGKIVFEGRDITGMSVTDVCQLGLTKSYQVNQLFNRLTVRENMTIAALAELRGKFRLDLLRSMPRIRGLREQVEHTLALVELAGAARHAGGAAGLRREAPARDRPGARLVAQPAAARRAARRHEPARAGARRCELLKSIGQRPHHDRHRPRHGCAVRAGRAHHRAAGGPRAGRGHAGRDQAQRRGAGSLSRRRARRRCTHEPARSRAGSTATTAIRTSCSTCRCGSRERGRGAARPQRRRQEHDAEEPDGRGDAAHRLGQARRRRDRRQEEPRHRARRHAAGARGAAHLRQPRRRGEPGARRAHRAEALAARAHLRDVPAPEGAARAAAAPTCPAASSRCWRSRAR